MGIVIRQSIKTVAVTLGGAMMGAIIAVLSTRFFSQQQLGFRDYLIKVAISIAYLANFGFGSALLIYGQKYPPGHQARSSFLVVSIIAPLIISLVVCLAYYGLLPFASYFYQDESLYLVRKYFHLFPLLTLITSATIWMEGYLQSLNKIALQSFAREILARAIYILLILLFAFNLISFSQFLWLYVMLYLVPFIFLLVIAIRLPGFEISYHKGLLSLAEIKDILRFGGYHMLTEASSVLILVMDVFVLGLIVDFKSVAIYATATLAISLLRNPTRMLGKAVTPTYAMSYNKGDMPELKSLFTRSAVNMQILGVGMFALVYININSIQHIVDIIHPGYEQIKPLMMILMLGQLIDMLTGFNYELIGVSKYYRFNFWIALLMLILVILLDYFLIKAIGLHGAAWAATISLLVFNFFKSYFLWVKMRLQPFSMNTLKVLGLGLIGGLLGWVLPHMFNDFIDLVLRSGIFALILWVLLYFGKVSEELNGVTDNIIKKKRLY